MHKAMLSRTTKAHDGGKPSYLWPRHAWVAGLSLGGERRKQPWPRLGIGQKIPASKARERFWKGLRALNNLCTDAFASYMKLLLSNHKSKQKHRCFLRLPWYPSGEDFSLWLNISTGGSVPGPLTLFPWLQQLPAPLSPLPRT